MKIEDRLKAIDDFLTLLLSKNLKKNRNKRRSRGFE